jgi:hypothetical protein
MDTSILTGYQLFHNYFREHEGLNVKTPAEIAGIKIQGENVSRTAEPPAGAFKY